ncbi:uncharacterized protein LOC134980700 isoform X2 [Pseudophryne corroboree]|uniref:uncharacterized protein LOC134980700 isoform X2 n=1 Tax=Pseudophryne corroboree TaxID=495146 RepID=UPI00308167DD
MGRLEPHKHGKFLTNGVVVSREMSCLQVSINMERIPENIQGRQLILSAEDSCERMFKVDLSPATGSDCIHSCLFHCIRNWNPELIVRLEVQGLEVYLVIC